ncbi:hypothetical protein SteCoe_23417 [Stentor coeruleus]|uniref:Uncharacterized protein n=1 Tax=Stentor coeruleus TaxID=5963 RepID=A0A1R2BKC6_9CILI|nr:hypothetical protein SteCoe_23417 [Stentor coeruleus]
MSTNTLSCSFPNCTSPALYLCKLCYKVTCWCPSHVKNHDSIASHSNFEEIYTTLNPSDSKSFANKIFQNIENLKILKSHATEVCQKAIKSIKILYKQTDSEIDKKIVQYKKIYSESLKNPAIFSDFYKKIDFLSKKNEKQIKYEGSPEKFKQKIDEICRKIKKYSLNLSTVEKLTDEKFAAMAYLQYAMINVDVNYLQYVCVQLGAKVSIGMIKKKCKICNKYIEDDKNIQSLCGGLVHKTCVKNYGQYATANQIISITFNCVTCLKVHALVTRNVQLCQYCKKYMTYFKADLNMYLCFSCISLLNYDNINFNIYKILSTSCKELLGSQKDLCYLCLDFAELYLNNTNYVCYPCALKIFSNSYSTITSLNSNEIVNQRTLSTNFQTLNISEVNPIISIQINELKVCKKIVLESYVSFCMICSEINRDADEDFQCCDEIMCSVCKFSAHNPKTCKENIGVICVKIKCPFCKVFDVNVVKGKFEVECGRCGKFCIVCMSWTKNCDHAFCYELYSGKKI